jgi:predicted acylesterase/phospholipase RssA
LKWLFKDIDAQGPPYDLVCGTSAGAINAAFAARASSASIAQVAQLWLGMAQANILQLVPPAQHAVNAGQYFQESAEHGYPRKLSYLSRANRELKAMGPKEDLGSIMGVVSSDGIDGEVKKYSFTLADMKTNLIVTATNMTRFSSDAFYHFTGPAAAQRSDYFLRRVSLASTTGMGRTLEPTGNRFALNDDNLVKAVLASAAVPGVFQPVAVPVAENGSADLFVDGGVANNTPVSTAVAAGASDVTVLIASAPNEGLTKPPTTLPALLQASFAVTQRKLLEDDVRIAIARNLLSREHNHAGLSAPIARFLQAIRATDWQPITLRIIRPAAPLKLTSMGFNDAEDLRAAFDEGYADAQNPAVYSI